MFNKKKFYIFCIVSINIIIIYWIFYFIYTIYLFLYLLGQIIKKINDLDHNYIEIFLNNIQVYFLNKFYGIWLNFCQYFYIENKESILNINYNFIKKHPFFISFYQFIFLVFIIIYLILILTLVKIFKLETLSFKLLKFTVENCRNFLNFLFLIIFLLFFF